MGTFTEIRSPEHQRTRQTRSDGSVEVYGGAQVTEKKGGVLTVKTYWPFGVGLETDVSGAPTVLNWVHADRLGSPVAISDQAGVLKEKLAYDAWGKRRSTDGTNLTPDSLDGVIDNRGFTGHEMLDQLDLVHMNGRVYDPSIGRFLTADLLISDPLDGQNYNRYAYVLNNPTNLTDPSGFSQEATADCNKKQACPSNQTPAPDCAEDCAKDAQGKPIRYAKNADGDRDLTVRTEPTAKSTNGQAKTDAKNSANSAAEGYRKAARDLIEVAQTAEIGWFQALVADPRPHWLASAAEFERLARAAEGDTAAIAGIAFDTVVLPVAGAALISGKPGATSQTAASRAQEIHGALDPRAQRARTTAVTETQEGIRVVSSSNRRLSPAQRALLKTNEVEGVGVGHAEVTGVNA